MIDLSNEYTNTIQQNTEQITPDPIQNIQNINKLGGNGLTNTTKYIIVLIVVIIVIILVYFVLFKKVITEEDVDENESDSTCNQDVSILEEKIQYIYSEQDKVSDQLNCKL